MLRSLTLGIALALPLVAPAPAAQAQSAAPSDAHAPDPSSVRPLSGDLIEKLSNSDWRQRQDAIHQLIAVGANAFNFRNGMSVELSVHAEPKVAFVRAISVELEQGLDANGHPLAGQTSRRVFSRHARGSNRRFPVVFERRADAENRIRRFQGTMKVAVQTRSEQWVVPDVLAMAPVARVVDSIPVTIDPITPIKIDGQDGFQFRLAFPAPWNSSSSREELLALVEKRLKVVDAEGHPLSRLSSDYHCTSEYGEITAEFKPVSRQGEQGTSADRIIWEVPAEMREMVIPFDFKDVEICDDYP